MSRLTLCLRAAVGAWVLLVLCAAGLMAPAAPVLANPLLGLNDPTRPPAGLVKSDRSGAAAAVAPEAASAASAPPSPPRESVLVLQLVRIDPVSGRGVALINDQLLEPGARIEGWTLLALTSNEAVLQGPRGRLRLSLTGDQVIERNPKSAQSRRGRKE